MDVIKYKKSRKGLHLALGIVAAFLVLIFFTWVFSNKNQPSLKRDTLRDAVVTRQPFTVEVAGSGHLVAYGTGAVVSLSGGIVRERLVRAGAQVENGDILLRLENPDLVAEHEDALNDLYARRAQVEAEKLQLVTERTRFNSNLQRAELELEEKASELEAKEQLFKSEMPIISRLDYNRVVVEKKLRENTLANEKLLLESFEKSYKAKLSELQYSLNTLENRAARLQRRVNDLNIRSPEAGIVQEVVFHEGDNVNPGQVVLRVVNTEKLYAVAQIPGYEIDKVQVGQKALVRINQENFTGQITRIDPEVKGSTVDVDIELDELPNRYRVNTLVRATIIVMEKTDALVVSRPANSRENAVNNVYVIQDNYAERRAVEFGIGSINTIEILSGLESHERIVISDLTDQVKQAERIRLR
ncbi:efflux RND transporter periplasmic adaptor subunit [Cellvibrio polysaccharolyticus]|uniref:HlyD family efflux transporter periplasmic adaptor subunit n=1 Tax=Cellvibrio polysaccharolyticus TaxID=2082724 RepID=A0A928V306_9GAMM|nr:HlyD family efflux transporter periplasmic adaptor subunit [Cellvibrio polysaccharolyticus]MBE8715704.1 HlyD family efflux transporter periplasmic adaptor subunit [Cellvibrio polysaccharolyticus]